MKITHNQETKRLSESYDFEFEASSGGHPNREAVFVPAAGELSLHRYVSDAEIAEAKARIAALGYPEPTIIRPYPDGWN